MQIGDLAKEAGVSTQTIRFYERRGLLKTPMRTQAGYRSYSDSFVQIVRFIKQSKELGYTLSEIKVLLNLHDSNGDTSQARTLALTKIENIDGQIKKLTEMRKSLKDFVDSCSCGTSAQPDCETIKQLDYKITCS